MPTTIRGGVPKVFRVTVPSSGVYYVPFLSAPSNFLQVTSSAACNMYFDAADATAGTNYISLSSTASFEGPASCKALWFTGAANVIITVYTRV